MSVWAGLLPAAPRQIASALNNRIKSSAGASRMSSGLVRSPAVAVVGVVGIALLLLRLAARRAALRLVREALGGVDLLLAGRERKVRLAIHTLQRLVFCHMILLAVTQRPRNMAVR